MIYERKHRLRFWLHAFVVGVVLTGQVHLYTTEILHHHDEDTAICKIAHDGGTYLHAAPGMTPVCPLCQVFHRSSVRPSAISIIPQSEGESPYRVVNREAGYTANFAPSLQARAPPLS